MNRIFAALALACASLFFAASAAFAGAGSGPFLGGGDPNKLSLMALPAFAVAVTIAIVAVCCLPSVARRLLIAFIAAAALAGCQTSASGWGQIAAGVGQMVGSTKTDPKVEKVMAQIHAYCPELRMVAAGATIFSPASVQKAAETASVLVRTACDAPAVRTVGEAIALSGLVVETVLAARQAQAGA